MVNTSREAAESAITAMLRERGFDGIVRSLMSGTRAPQAMVEDAVMQSVAETLRQADNHELTNVPAYVYLSSRRELIRMLKADGRIDSFSDMDEPEDVSTPFNEVEARDLLRHLKSLTKDWNLNIRSATNLALDYAFLDQWPYITMEDFATELQSILGVEVSPSTAAMWKSRGLRRLRAIILGQEDSNTNDSEWRNS